MTTKKAAPKAAEAPKPPGHTISNCHFETNSAANEHTRAAIQALASAAEANARAIEAAARALEGASACAISIRG